MIEQGIYFALGCIVTALAALLFAPVFWRRALRLTRQRLQLQIPLSMQEILAERDELRAEFAVERVRLEQALTREEARSGRMMAELGRRTVETVSLTEARDALRVEAETKTRTIAELENAVSATGAQLLLAHKSRDDLAIDRDQWREKAKASLEAEEKLRADVDRQRTSIAGLETAKSGLEIRLQDVTRDFEHEREGARVLRTKLETAMMQSSRHESAAILLRGQLDDANVGRRQLEEEINAQRAALREVKRGHEKDLAAQREALPDRDKINGLLRRERDEVRLAMAKLENELSSANVALSEARGREVELEARLAAREDQQASLAALRRELQEAYGRIRQFEQERMLATSAKDAAAGMHAITQKALDEARAEVAREQASRAAVEAEVAEARRAQADLRDRLEALERERDGLAATVAGAAALATEKVEAENALSALRQRADNLDRDLREARSALTDARERERANQLAQSLQAEKGRRGERLLVNQVEALASENAELRAALGGVTEAGDGIGDGDLRKSIHAIGLAVADMTRKMSAGGTRPAKGQGRRRRQNESPPPPVSVA